MRLIRTSRGLALAMTCSLLVAAVGPFAVPSLAVNQAMAASSVKVDAAELQLNMRRSLSTILVAYKKEPKTGSRADAMIIKAATGALRELGNLESGTKTRDPKKMTAATSSLAVAIGRIEAISDSAKIANPTVREGLRALSTNWAAYGTRYALAQPPRSNPVKVSAKQVSDLQAQVASLRSQVKNLQAETRTNTQLKANVQRLSAQLERIEQNRIDADSYQRTMFMLGSYMGWMDGYQVVTTTYYPTYTRYFVVEVVTYEYWERSWIAYYEPYYSYTDWDYYADPFTPVVDVNIQIDASTRQEVNIFAEQNTEVIINDGRAAERYFESLPAEQSDVEIQQADYTLPTPAYELEDKITTFDSRNPAEENIKTGNEARTQEEPATILPQPEKAAREVPEKEAIESEDVPAEAEAHVAPDREPTSRTAEEYEEAPDTGDTSTARPVEEQPE